MEPTVNTTVPPSVRDLLLGVTPPKWVEEMKDEYARRGTVRPEDLYRLLGDPNKRVEVKSEMSVASLLTGFTTG